jgi:hypothetical protein
VNSNGERFSDSDFPLYQAINLLAGNKKSTIFVDKISKLQIQIDIKPQHIKKEFTVNRKKYSNNYSGIED